MTREKVGNMAKGIATCNDGWKGSYVEVTEQGVENSMELYFHVSRNPQQSVTPEKDYIGTRKDIKFCKPWRNDNKLLRAWKGKDVHAQVMKVYCSSSYS